MSSISGISGASAWMRQDSLRSQQQARLFTKIDADGSGGVDATELTSALQAVADRTGTTLDADAAELLSGADTDGNGSLSASELDAVVRSVLPEPPSTFAFAAARSGDAATMSHDSSTFSALDTDGDGVLSQAEFEAGRPEGPPPGMGGPGGPPPTASADDSDALQSLLSVADTNGDQSLDSSETQRLVGYIADALQALDSEASSDTSGTATASHSDPEPLDFTALAELVRKQYEQLAATVTTGSTLDTSA